VPGRGLILAHRRLALEDRGPTQIASGHFGNFDDILLQEDLEETDYEDQYPSIEDRKMSHKVDTLRYRFRGGQASIVLLNRNYRRFKFPQPELEQRSSNVRVIDPGLSSAFTFRTWYELTS